MVPNRVVLFRAIVRGFLLLLSISPLCAASATISGADGLTVNVQSSGVYTINLTNPAWRFSGQTGFPLSNLYTAVGSDAMGPYQEITFDFQSDAPHHAAIRAWFNQMAVMFTASNSSTAANSLAFPSFTQFPKWTGRIAFAGMFGYPTFFGTSDDSPWIAFDSAANTFVLSPLTHAMVASTANAGGVLSSGISTKIAALPAGFTQQTLLVIETGINRGFDTWGKMMTTLSGKVRPANDADLMLKTLGYWTDNGATYYYATDPALSYSDTLRAVKADFDRQGIALGYLQLDSWFYPKGAAADWNDHGDGMYEYHADPLLFPSSLASFQQALGAPLMTHARWIDASSPYRQQYQISGDVSIDPLYWGEVARYLANSGVTTYEQDWLYDHAQTAFNLTDPDAFLDNMAGAMAQQNLTMQYCMPTARHFLQGARYSNLTSIRTSEDRFGPTRWRNFLYASRLASALGIWPFTDVFMSTETGNLLVANLSAGPVGVGDPIGTMSTANLFRVARRDGVIVKPDVPLTPLDSSYLSDSQIALAPLISSAYTDFDGLRAWYVFAFPQGANTVAQFQPADFGVGQAIYLYNAADGTGRVVQPWELVSESITNQYIYHVATPIGPSGMAIIGDTGHFVTLGRKRITRLADDGTVHLTVAFAKGELSRTIEGYSPMAPTVSVVEGDAGPMSYDAQAQRFAVSVAPGPAGFASIEITKGARSGLAPGSPRRSQR